MIDSLRGCELHTTRGNNSREPQSPGAASPSGLSRPLGRYGAPLAPACVSQLSNCPAGAAQLARLTSCRPADRGAADTHPNAARAPPLAAQVPAPPADSHWPRRAAAYLPPTGADRSAALAAAAATRARRQRRPRQICVLRGSSDNFELRVDRAH